MRATRVGRYERGALMADKRSPRSGGRSAGAKPTGVRLVAALDIGSSKVCALIAQVGEGGALRILGTGQRESRGVKRGYIADMATTERAVREAVEQAERIAGM